jgi:plasmid stabilization system protein ParE
MSDAYRIIILREASANISEIHAHIEQTSPQNAAPVVRKLIEAIDSLEQFPHRYKVHVSNSKPERVVHSVPVPPFIIYYRVIERNRAVEVMTIRHGARRQPQRFS